MSGGTGGMCSGAVAGKVPVSGSVQVPATTAPTAACYHADHSCRRAKTAAQARGPLTRLSGSHTAVLGTSDRPQALVSLMGGKEPGVQGPPAATSPRSSRRAALRAAKPPDMIMKSLGVV